MGHSKTLFPIPLYPDKSQCSIEELEKRLNFQYLPANIFETDQGRSTVYEKGIQKLNQGKVTAEAIENGKRFVAKIRTHYLPHVSIHLINEEVGYGLFAEEEIAEGSFVGEYTGTVRENDRRHFEPLNNYCYEYPIPDDIGRSYVIDATHGNLTRLINHSSNPNLKPCYAFIDGFYHCIFIAIKPIAKGSQLFYDYGKSYWNIRSAPEEINSV